MKNMFQKTNQNMVYCINNISTNIKEQLVSSNLKNNNCSDICFFKSKKIILENKKCVINCNDSDLYKYEYNNICYESCPNGTHKSLNNIYLCEKDLICDNYYNYDRTECVNNIKEGYYLNNITLKTIDKCNIKCKNCTLQSMEQKLCISCNINNSYYPKYDDNLNNSLFIDCYNYIPDGYYLDRIYNIYQLCFPTCKKCIEYGDKNNNKCLEYINGYNFIYDFENVNNCYEKCKYYYYFVSSNNYYCTENEKCPVEYSKIILEKKRCIDDCSKDNIYKYEYNNKCYKECPNNINIIIKDSFLCENETNFYNWNIKEFFNGYYNKYLSNNQSSIKDEIIKNIRNGIMKSSSNFSNIIKGEKPELIIKYDDIVFQIISSDYKNNNISEILFGECENILKNNYKINENQSLILLKIDYFNSNYLIPIIDYELFHPETKEKLNLSLCNNTSIKLSIPVSIDENNLFKYNPNSEYYTNEYNPYKTKDGTDIILNDRYDEYNNNNMSACENDCILKEYEKDTKKVICECKIKYNDISISEITNNTNDLLSYNFNTKSESSNLVTMKCVYTLFTKDGIITNIANYILIFFILFFIISGILFYKCGYNNLEDDIKEILELKEEENRKEMNRLETIDIK